MSTASLTIEQTAVSTHADGALRRIFSFPVMLASILVVLAVLTVRSRFDDPDMWWHLKTGEVIWTTHSIPTTDHFSYTTNHHAVVPQEWLSQVLIYGAYRFGGYSGLMLWMCFFTSALLIAGYALCSLYSGNAKVGWVGALLIWFFATVGYAVRPQMVGYFLLTIELLILHFGRTRSARWFLLLPPWFLIWVNCHGSFSFGIGVAGLIFLCSFFNFQMGSLEATRWDRRRSLILGLALVASTAALFVNPVGIKLIKYPLDVMLHLPINLTSVEEWKPLQMNTPRGIGLLGICACIFLLVIVQRSKLLWHELVLLAAGTWFAVHHERMTFVFGLLAAPTMARLLSTAWDNYQAEKDRWLPNAVIITLSLLTIIWEFPSRHFMEQQAEDSSPVKAVEFMKVHHLSGNMFNEYVYGGYLIWAAPENQVFIDGRGDIFEWTGVLGDYGKLVTLDGDPNVVLDKYKIDFCLLSKGESAARILPLLHGWNAVYSDKISVILARSSVNSSHL
jgi:hypothetical protein